MARQLETAHEAALGRCSRRTTLQITLSNGTPLNLASSDIEFGELIFLGKISPVDALNLDLTQSDEGINLQVSNITLVFGQTLINNTDVLSGAESILGCYFRDPLTGDEWHDEKLRGVIEVGDIDGDWVNIFFQTKTSAAVYNGVTIESLFPDETIPAAQIPNTTTDNGTNNGGGLFNDINNLQLGDTFLTRKMSPLIDDLQFGGRYYLPENLAY